MILPERQPTAGPHLAVLVFVVAIGPMSMTAFLPALPDMAADLGTDYAAVQLAVPIYLVSVALLQLVLGPASDRFGRRPVMLVSIGLFLAATLAATFAPTISFLLAARVFQGFAVGGMVLSRAIVRDTVGPDEAASRLGYVVMAMVVVPLCAPGIGGLLNDAFGWRSVFALVLGVGVIALFAAVFGLPETNFRRSASIREQWRSYRVLVADRLFWGYTLTVSLLTGGYFAFLGGGPFVSTEVLGLSPTEYGIWFAGIALGYMFGNFLSGRFSTRIGISRMMLAGALLTVVGMLACVAAFALGWRHPLALFVPCAIANIGMGLNQPSAFAGIVSVRPDLAGSASGLAGTTQMGCGAIFSLLVGAFLSPAFGPWPLVLVMLFTAVAATIVCVATVRATSRPAVG